MVYWFTSDTHFGHANILIHDHRPFSSIEEHDNGLIANWNERVAPGDVVFHLGDVAWHRQARNIDTLLRQLHGTKILITGNHDERSVTQAKGWAKVTPYHELTTEGHKLILFHYPLAVWNRSHHGSWALHGHCHGTLPVDLNAMRLDVGTMCWNYTPVSFEQIAHAMSHHRWVPVDGHGRTPQTKSPENR